MSGAGPLSELSRFMRVFAPVLAVAAAVLAIAADGAGAGTAEKAVVGAAPLTFVAWAWWPRFGCLPLTAITTVAVVFAVRDGRLEPAVFMLSVVAVVVGTFEDSRWRLIVAGLLLLAAPGFVWLVFTRDFVAGIWTLGILLPLALTYGGERQQRLAFELAATRAELADQRVLEERRRIARDVHDSVGHGLAAMLLHITGARHVLRRDPAAADEALAEAEAVGKRSMVELRETLGMLRAGTDPDSTTPATGPVPPVPDARRLGDLGVEIVGDLDRIDPLVGRSLHRVAEEAFANARRHAPDAATAARLDVGDERAVLTIESRGPLTALAADDPDRPRFGIVGMSERIAAVGGALDVGPTDQGWLVRATVPLQAPAR